jgi:hypothetical protein
VIGNSPVKVMAPVYGITDYQLPTQLIDQVDQLLRLERLAQDRVRAQLLGNAQRAKMRAKVNPYETEVPHGMNIERPTCHGKHIEWPTCHGKHIEWPTCHGKHDETKESMQQTILYHFVTKSTREE